MDDSNRQKRSFREKRWSKIIEEARADPEGVASYCRARAISVNTYYGWFKRLRVDHPEWTDLKPQPNRSAISSTFEKPETEVQAKAKRRTFSSAYKARILLETDSAGKGEVASILRREGLYSSHLEKFQQLSNFVQAHRRLGISEIVQDFFNTLVDITSSVKP